MSEVGYYRYKITPIADRTAKIYINGVATPEKIVKVLPWCDGNKRIKFLNKNGQYRFAAFNRFHESSDKPKEIGQVNKIITSLLHSQSETNSVGMNTTRTLNLVADDVSSDQLEILKDLWLSPRVYLYIGNGTTDLESDYILVTAKVKNPVNNIMKGSYLDLVVELELPKHYTITMI